MTLITNHYPNPLFNSRGALPSPSGGSGTITCIDAQRQLRLQSTDAGGVQAAQALTGLPASTRNGCLCVIGSTASGWTELARGGNPQSNGVHDTVTIEFTTPQDANGTRIVFDSPLKTGAVTVFDRPMLMTKTDWDWWQRNNHGRLLSGDLMPLS